MKQHPRSILENGPRKTKVKAKATQIKKKIYIYIYIYILYILYSSKLATKPLGTAWIQIQFVNKEINLYRQYFGCPRVYW